MGQRQSDRKSQQAWNRFCRCCIILDNDILECFHEQVHLAGDGNDQTLINDALREHIQQSREPLEATLRPVLREELERSRK
jgi:uncharacterized protein (DUF4415 family)